MRENAKTIPPFSGDNALSSNKDLAEYHKMLKSDLRAKRMSMRNLLSVSLHLKSEANSVTRFGDFLHFGQPFKAGGNNYFTQITLIVRQFL